MSISNEKEHIPSPLGHEVVSLNPSPIEPNQGSLDQIPPYSDELPESPPKESATICSDVKVVLENDEHDLQRSIASLEGEILQLGLQQKSLNEKKKQVLNKILNLRGSIRVLCRVRPFLPSNRIKNHEAVSAGAEKIVIKSAGIKKEYGFDKVFPPETRQDEVFAEVEPILTSALHGQNVSIIAYGQTGTGKTFTMNGTDDHPGIVPQALKMIFRESSSDSSATFEFSISMLEIYMGSLRDLLAPTPSYRAYEAASKGNLNIQTDSKGAVEIEGLTNVPISDVDEANWWYTRGREGRSTSWTNVNEASSRSHCLTRITISRHDAASKEKLEVSKLWLVDLGGSERLLKTGATGQTLAEGRSINLSLSALGHVIAALRRKQGHVPYRNSKLTQILKDSLGAISKVMMLVHISPYEEDVPETICSLAFAKRARAVGSIRELPEDLRIQKEIKIAKLEEEMRNAEKECQTIRNQIQKAELHLSENKKLFSSYDHLLEDESETTTVADNDPEVLVAMRKAYKRSLQRNISNSVPRFMASTVASRQRQSDAERDTVTIARTVSSGRKSSLHFVSSSFLNFHDPHFRGTKMNANRRLCFGRGNTFLYKNPKSCDMDTKSEYIRKNKVTSSHPSHHKRRMSDLI